MIVSDAVATSMNALVFNPAGVFLDLPDGTRIGYRTDSTSGKNNIAEGPTVDVKLPTGTKYKVHVPK